MPTMQLEVVFKPEVAELLRFTPGIFRLIRPPANGAVFTGVNVIEQEQQLVSVAALGADPTAFELDQGENVLLVFRPMRVGKDREIDPRRA